MKYFENCITLEEVKEVFRKWCIKLHPDNNPGRDTTKDFQEMKSQYEKAFNRCKNTHRNAEGETYSKETEETPEMYADIISRLVNIPDISVELCGSWLWVTGNTRDCKDILKEMHFRFSAKKTAWYFHFEPFRKRSKKTCTMDEIRNMYGSKGFHGTRVKALEEALA